MLFQQLEKIKGIIKHYNNEEGWSHFLEEAFRNDPPGLHELKAAGGGSTPSRVLEMTKLAVGAQLYQKLIAPLPVIMTVMRQILEGKEFRPHLRCGLAGALAYLVRSDDILPERKKGTPFQLVDDSLIIHYSYYRFLREVSPLITLNGDMLERYYGDIASVMKAGFSIFPPQRLPEIQKALVTVAMGFYYLREAPDYQLEKVIEQILQNPDQNKLKRVLARMAYNLDVGFQPYSHSIYYDPLLKELGVSAAEAGIRAGGKVNLSDLYY